jgi:hypothetical protein
MMTKIAAAAVWTVVSSLTTPTIVGGTGTSTTADSSPSSHDRQIKALVWALVVTVVLLVIYLVWHACSIVSERRFEGKEDMFEPNNKTDDTDNESSPSSSSDDGNPTNSSNADNVTSSPVGAVSETLNSASEPSKVSTETRGSMSECVSSATSLSSRNKDHEQTDVEECVIDGILAMPHFPLEHQLEIGRKSFSIGRKSFSTLVQDFVRNIDLELGGGDDDGLDARSVRSSSLKSYASSACIFFGDDASSCSPSQGAAAATTTGRTTPLGDEDSAWNEFIFSDEALSSEEQFVTMQSSSLSGIVAEAVAPEDYVMPNPWRFML